MKKIFNKLLRQSIFLVELKENQLTLTHAKKNPLSGSIYIINVSNIQIESTAFRNGIIYKPSLIGSHITEFIRAEKLVKPKTFISIPCLNEKHDLALTLAIFQATLCICKANVRIVRVSDSPSIEKIDQPNLLEHIGSKNIKSPYPWILTSVACILLAFTCINHAKLKSDVQIKSLQNSTANLQKTIPTLSQQAKCFDQAKRLNAQIKSVISKIDPAELQKRNTLAPIAEISSKIPVNAYLTHISFTQKPSEKHITTTKSKSLTHKKSIKMIEIEGFADKIQCANSFINSLSKNSTLLKNVELVYIKKVKSTEKNKKRKKAKKQRPIKYQFRASGAVNYIC